MAKKKRRSAKSDSTAKRVLKVGGAVLAVGAGAALFSRKGGLDKLSKVVPAIRDTHVAFRKELLNKDHTAMNIYNAYNKTIGKRGEQFRKTLAKKATQEYSFSTARLSNIGGKLKNIRQTSNVKLPHELIQENLQQIKKGSADALIAQYKDKYSEKDIRQIVDATISKYKEISDSKGNVSIDFLKRTKEVMNIDDDDLRDMVQKTAYAARKGTDPSVINQIRKDSITLAREVEEKRIQNIKKGTRENQWLNKLGKKIGIDNLDDKLFGMHQATIGEVLDSDLFKDDEEFAEIIRNRVKLKGTENNHMLNTMKDIRRLAKEDEEFRNVIFDKNLLAKTGADGKLEFLDMTETMELIDDKIDKFNSTIVGKILTKGIDRKGLADAPGAHLLLSGKKSMAAWLDGADDQILKKAKVVVDNQVYELLHDKNGYHLSEEALAEGHSFNMLHGSFSGVIKNILGTDKIDPVNSQNPLLKKLDIGQTGRPNMFARIEQWFKKFDNPDWERNIIERVQSRMSIDETMSEKVTRLANEMGVDEIEAMARMHEDNKIISEMFANRAASSIFDDEGVAKLRDTIDALISSGAFGQDSHQNYRLSKVQDLINLALSKDRPEDVLEELMNLNSNGLTINSKSLSNLIDRYQSNAAETMEMLDIQSKVTKKVPILDMELAETNVTDISGIIRREILKEITTEEDISNVLKAYSGFNGQQFEAFELLNQWQKWQTATTASDADNLFTAVFANGSALDRLEKEIFNNDAAYTNFNAFLDDFKGDFGFFHKGSFNGMHESYGFEYQTHDFVTKSRIGKDLLTDVNNLTKLKAAGKEFIAGRDDLEHVSPATLVTQYLINRLSMGVEEAGLGLSSESLSSPLKALSSMMTKRVMPAMAAFTVFSYLNDRSEDVMGTSITGAMLNNVANLDIASRRLAYSTGVGQALDWFKRTSVIGEYWTGSTEFQDKDERREWYREGYSPVRKSRFWGFGSASEFRGGDISFFQPNYLRRVHSDYKDKVLYGSNSEKWAHSIIPTPTHPLSTIRYLMDPYWLERKHIDDAPTPLTGKMFSEGTFWGDILNPTIGEVIKPQIMLPEIKKRMTGKGHDVKNIVRRINERTKRKASEYDDMLVVNGTDIRNATYVPYGNATPGTITVTPGGEIRGMDYMDAVQDMSMYRTPDGTTYTERSGGGFGPPVTRQMESGGIINNTINDFIQELERSGEMSKGIISELNSNIKSMGKARGRGRQGGPSFASQTPNASYEGTYIYNNLVNEYNNYAAQYYSDKLDPRMINTSKYGDYLHDVKHSAKNLIGIYGFLSDQVFDDGGFTLRYEHAGSYSSFSRGFWDAGIGGLGGGMMEIARRFFPSSDKSRIDYNPLVNNMPEWLPEKFRTGVPWTKVTKGEMRLPGKGYESLNDLHPDEFADENGYGSFDKFKILADIAPNSNEYKIWHNIVKHNIKDPELKEEIKEIEARTKRMSGSHEFYDYQYLHTNTEYNKGVVKTINKDGTITLANNQILTLAGIEFNENYTGELSNLLTPGQKITYRTEQDVVNDPTGEGVIRKAAIYPSKYGDTINKQLMSMGVADRDMSDTSSIGNLATISSTQESWGAAQELLAHARIPIIHNKLMHIESPLEAFISEQVYGANFQTWDHPIEGFVKPMINEVMGQGLLRRAAARGYREFHFNKVLTQNHVGFSNKAKKFASGLALTTLDPAAMLGGTVNWVLKLNNGRVGDGTQTLGAFSKGAKIGGTLGDVAWAWGQADNPLSGAIAFGALAGDIFRKYQIDDFAKQVFGKNVTMKTALMVGAGIGAGVSAIKNNDWDSERMFGKFMPKKYKEINELNEYFDRLDYIKYKGLYEAASRKAALLEGTYIKGVFKDLDRNKAKIAKLKRKAEKLLDKYDEGDSEYKAQMAEIQRKIDSLQESGNNVFKGGKYTKSAIAYKKAMESTIYGLSEGATKDEILASIPDQYKDYFQKFMDVRDESERKKILKYMPSYLKRPLQMAWGMKMDDVESNRKYFKTHKLPNMNWRGWKPNINLKHVKMKTVENEGMLLADFGFYDSERGKAAYEVAPEINDYDTPGKFSMFSSIRLMSEMKGFGLNLTNVSIDRTSTPGMWIGADIKQNISDRTELATNSMNNIFQGIASNFF